MRATRPRQTCSRSVSSDATDRTACTSPLASCSRPLRRFVSTFESVEALQQVLDMGVVEGASAAINQIDDLLAV